LSAHALPGFRVALGDRLVRKTAGDIDQRIEPAEVRRDGVDGFLGLGRVRRSTPPNSIDLASPRCDVP
jgi:hypothetical protein